MKPYPTIEEVEKRVGKKIAAWDMLPDTLIKHICDADRERRGGEGDSIPWAEYPWAKWAAKDADGSIWFFDRTPQLMNEDDLEWWPAAAGDLWERIENATIPGPWQESLRKRPADL